MQERSPESAQPDVDSFAGRAERLVHARDPVTVTRIRDFATAVGDRNPGYADATSARAAGFADIVAPPALLQSWTLPRIQALPDGPTIELYDLLDSHGFTSLIAVGYTQRYHRYLSPGDEISARLRIQSVSQPKRTRLGEAYFITSGTEFRDQAEDVVGEMEWTLMKYRAAGDAVAATGASATAAELPGGDGELLPELVTTMSATDIVAGALASNDYTPIHHDRAAANESGEPDIFMNILTSCGWLHRYVTDWAGPSARLLGTEFRLGSPIYPGDEVRFTGKVTERDGPQWTVLVSGSTPRGEHVRGTVTLAR